LHQNHLDVEHVDLGVDVEALDQDEGGEGDHDDVGERVSEHEQTQHQDDGALVDALPNPNAECSKVHASSFLKSLVERWVGHDTLLVSVFVKDQGEDGQGGVDGGVTQHQETIVDWNRHKVEEQGEGSLDY
jgi:hypothetical protein